MSVESIYTKVFEKLASQGTAVLLLLLFVLYFHTKIEMLEVKVDKCHSEFIEYLKSK